MARFDSLTDEESLLEERSNNLVLKLNDAPESPWHKQIFIDDVGCKKLSELFVGKLKPLLNERRRGILHVYNIEEQYGILRNYFVAVKIVLPHVWDRRTQRNSFSFLMALFPAIFQLCLSMYNDFKIDSIVNILGQIEKNGPIDSQLSKAHSRECLKEILAEVTGSIKKTRKVKL